MAVGQKDFLEASSSSEYAISEGYPLPEWRRGAKWILSRQLYSEERGDPPHICWSPDWVEMTPRGTYLVTDRVGQAIEITDDYDILWEYGPFDPPLGVGEALGSDVLSSSLPNAQLVQDYPSEGQDSVVISDLGNNRILLVDQADNSVLEELTSIDSGTLSSPVARVLVSERVAALDDRELVLCDRDNHYAAAVDWTGTEYASFGVWGTPGSDDTHLNTPYMVSELPVGTGADNTVVADHDNHRLLLLDEDFGLRYSDILPLPRSVHIDPKRGYPAVGSWYLGGAIELGDGSLHFCAPFGTTFCSRVHDGIIWRRHGFIVHQSFRPGLYRDEIRYADPRTFKFLDSVSLDANASSDYCPFAPQFFERTTVKALTDQDATLEIYTMETPARNGTGICLRPSTVPPTWQSYDSVSLTANTPEHYVLNRPLGVMAARITMGATAGTADLWVQHGLGT